MDNCSICMDAISTEIAKPNACVHLFCAPCIEQWAQQGNDTCPLCRSVFRELHIRETFHGPTSRVVKLGDGSNSAESGDDDSSDSPETAIWSIGMGQFNGMLNWMAADPRYGAEIARILNSSSDDDDDDLDDSA